MDLQSIFDIPEICHLHGIRHAVLSPGSRNAALTVAFARHPHISCYSVPDERSAAFIALGMSLYTKVPTVLICTSGSAALNYGPAIAEAFFNQVPLLILTADRPPEFIGIRDGQTIFQPHLYGKHVKAYFDYPSLHNESHKIITKAIETCVNQVHGSVHINIPFSEPFYPEKGKNYAASANLKAPNTQKSKEKLFTDFAELTKFNKILIVAGQDHYDPELLTILSEVAKHRNIPIISDVIGNLHEIQPIMHHDLYLKNCRDEHMFPDLFITFGLSLISKSLKSFLRNCSASQWHISDKMDMVDTFNNNPKSIESSPKTFFIALLNEMANPKPSQLGYQNSWKTIDRSASDFIKDYQPTDYCELSLYQHAMHLLPHHCDLHLANSMAVRYANIVGLEGKKDIHVYCNRGTSGIDGSNSTAVGTALLSNRPTFLFTGDMAFLYDRNAFWHNHVPDNLSIIVFNNHGGGIFRLIEGPSDQPELEEYFETRQKSSAIHVASEFGFEYMESRDLSSFKSSLTSFLQNPSKRKILEVFTQGQTNQNAFKEMFQKFRN